MTITDIFFLLRWLGRADDLPPELAVERERIITEIENLYYKATKTKERYR